MENSILINIPRIAIFFYLSKFFFCEFMMKKANTDGLFSKNMFKADHTDKSTSMLALVVRVQFIIQQG